MARRIPRERPTVERKIYFYRINAGTDSSGRPRLFDVRPVLNHIESLPFTPDGRYLAVFDGNSLCCWVDNHNSPQKLRIANVRRNGLPQIESAGNLSPLNLPATSGLGEEVHVMFFPGGIVGSEFNFYGPRISRLASYLFVKGNGTCQQISFEPLLRRDVSIQLDRLSDIRLMHLKMHVSYTGILAEADRDLATAFSAASRAGEAEEIEILLRPAKYSRATLSGRLLSVVKRIARRNEIREAASTFRVRGLDRSTNSVGLVDILSDQLIARKQIVLLNERTRGLERDSTYAAIREAYLELQNDLHAAAGIRQ